MLDLLGMMFLVVLMLLTVGSGFCALVGLTLIGKGGGLIYVIVGGSVAAASFLAFLALYRRLFERPPEGPDERPR
jgi:hypothetical protein